LIQFLNPLAEIGAFLVEAGKPFDDPISEALLAIRTAINELADMLLGVWRQGVFKHGDKIGQQWTAMMFDILVMKAVLPKVCETPVPGADRAENEGECPERNPVRWWMSDREVGSRGTAP
jgi:hypothetical protein